MDVEQPGVRKFTDLADVPHSYIGQGLQLVSINVGETAVVFTSPDADIASSISLTNQAADITDTAFTVNTAGLYRIEFYVLTTTTDITAGAITLNIKYSDDATTRTISTAPITLAANTGFAQGEIVIRLASGNLTYGVTHSGIFGTAVYALYLTQEKLQ